MLISSFLFDFLFKKILKSLTNTEPSECPLFRKKYVARHEKHEKSQEQIASIDLIKKMHLHFFMHKSLTFLATKSTTIRATIKQPAAILAVRRFVEASIKAIPQNDEPRSRGKTEQKKIVNAIEKWCYQIICV